MVTSETTMLLISIAPLLLLMLLIFLWICKPWRSSSRNNNITTVGDLERPLVSEDLDQIESQSDELAQNIDFEGSHIQIDEHISSSESHGFAPKQKNPSTDVHVTHGASLVLDVISDPSDESLVGQTLKRPLVTNSWQEENKSARREGSNHESTVHQLDDYKESVPEDIAFQRSSLTLEVKSGPSRGTHCSLQSTDNLRLPLTLGRVFPSNLLLKDGEVSGKHAMINWNSNKLKWELVDMGSLNGTLLNSLPVHNSDSGSRHWSEPFELSSGDIITLGTTSKIHVQITRAEHRIPFGVGVASDPMSLRRGGKKLPMEDVSYNQRPLPGVEQVQITRAEHRIPFGVGIASDPMSLRRGGKKLPMEDVSYNQWPLPGVEQFGLFGICDGHSGPGAARAASKILPETIASILSISENRERVLSHCDASSVLRDAFIQTESAMHHQYEGCTATVLLVWADGHEEFSAQCANVGDSACLMNIRGRQIDMTEDHRITAHAERIRLNETGKPLKDGETRLCGLNLARMLGDKFLKEQDSRFSSEPYISQVVHIDKESKAFALMASDGLWDVISFKKAMQLVLEARARDRYTANKGRSAEKIANLILSEARTLRTKDNTSIIFLDFDTLSRTDFL